MTEHPQDQPQQPGEPMPPDGQQAPQYYGAQPPPPGAVPGWAPAYGYQAQPPVSPSDARMWSVFAHLGSFIVFFIAPLVIYLIYKDRDPFIRRHAAQAMNFQITVAIASFVSVILTFVIVGIFTGLAVVVCWIVFPILAAVAANKGEPYTYPVAIPMIT